MNLKSAVAIASLALGVPATGAEAESGASFGWSLDAGMAHTDNANLTRSDRIEDTVASVGGGVNLSRRGNRVDTTLDATGSLVHYLDDTFDDDLLGRASGNLTVRLLPERISWTFDDSYGQIASDPFAPATPENQQDVNVFSTGPDMNLLLGSQEVQLLLSGRYGDTRFEGTGDIDTRHLGGTVGVRRASSPAASIGLFGARSHFDYVAEGLASYDQQAAWFSWNTHGPRNQMAVDLGANQVRMAGQTLTAPLVRVDWERRVRPSWTLNVLLGYEYQNTGQQFASGSTTTAGITNLPAAVRRGELSFTFERSRTRFVIGGGLRRHDYDGATELDEDAWSTRLDIGYRLTPRLQGFLGYRVERRGIDAEPARTIKVQTGSVGLDWRLGRSAFVTGGYTYVDSDGNTVENQYSGNLLSVRLSWRGGETAEPRTLRY